MLDLVGPLLRGLVATAVILGGAVYVDRAALVGTSITTRVREVARTRWPYLIIVVSITVADFATQRLPDPRGHWSGHAMTAFSQLSVAVALVVTACLVRRLGAALLLAGVVVVGLAIAASGNWEVAESIWRTSYGDTAVSEAVALDPASFTNGHERANTGEVLAWVAGIGFVLLAGLLRKVPVRTACIGGALAIMPPWILGGVGALFVLARAAVLHNRGFDPPFRKGAVGSRSVATQDPATPVAGAPSGRADLA